MEVDKRQIEVNKAKKLYKANKISHKEYIHCLYSQYYGDSL